MPFKVEMNCCGHWEDAEWSENNQPMRFATATAANTEIDEHIYLTHEAFARGDMAEPHDRRDYRAVPC